MRTDNEIIAKIKEVDKNDFFGTKTGDLISVLPFSAARPFLRDDLPEDAEENWTPDARDASALLDRVRGYLPFAWDKANGCRGLSAARSLDHFWSWFWLMGHDIPVAHYSHYGKPQLRAISEAVGFPWEAHDNGHWTNNEDEDGCGRMSAANLGLPSFVAPA